MRFSLAKEAKRIIHIIVYVVCVSDSTNESARIKRCDVNDDGNAKRTQFCTFHHFTKHFIIFYIVIMRIIAIGRSVLSSIWINRSWSSSSSSSFYFVFLSCWWGCRSVVAKCTQFFSLFILFALLSLDLCVSVFRVMQSALKAEKHKFWLQTFKFP